MSDERTPLHPRAELGELPVNGTAVPFHDTGEPGDFGSTIVLVHGTGGSTESHYRTVYPMLAARHRVIGIDVQPTDDSTMDDLTQQIEAVITQRVPGAPVHLVGYSLGAVLTARIAGRSPQLVQTLTLIAGWIKTDKHQRLRNTIWTALMESDGGRTLQEFQILMAHHPQFLRTRPDGDLERLISNRTFRPGIAGEMRINFDADISLEIEQISAPTLVIGCLQDQMVPIMHSYQLFGGIRNARLAEVDAGHAVTVERPAQVFMLIDDFVREPEAVADGEMIPALTI
ncbi:alpha/beta hydrolase [Citricoccus sp. I39-566]|uniref:alpha/beta fold hydrolase n=1 Tax=Citricoccus sp. I39-566 TaxID=3073268 RepID=UPI00286BBAC5|nr:alpha/beta hydrolase [Citricoccus sp. I39-566]WMY78558.1 alpha/beta hydrolase [Citricoccus sp. I39-566]